MTKRLARTQRAEEKRKKRYELKCPECGHPVPYNPSRQIKELCPKCGRPYPLKEIAKLKNWQEENLKVREVCAKLDGIKKRN